MRNQLLGLDYETTSADPGRTRGVQLAAIARFFGRADDGNPYDDEMHVILNEVTDPGAPISLGASQVHGYTDAMVAGKRKDSEVTAELYDYVAEHIDSIVLVTHNGTVFDLPIFYRLAAEVGGRPPLTVPHIDTLVCATRLWPKAPNHKLSVPDPETASQIGPGLVQYLKISEGREAHDAEADARMVLDLADYAARYADMGYESLAEWCGRPKVLEVCHLGKHKGKRWGRGVNCVPEHYVRWMTRNWSSATPDMIATLRHHYGLEFDYLREPK